MSIFTKEEMLWTTLHYEDESPTKLKSKFCKVFNVPKKRAANLKGFCFTRYKESFVKNFEQSGSGYSSQSIIWNGRKYDVKDYFLNNENSTIRDAAQDLNLSKSSVHRIIRYEIKMYPYRSHKVHELSDAHKEQRMVLCELLLKQPEGFVQRKIWSDEKWFLRRPLQTDIMRGHGVWCTHMSRKSSKNKGVKK